MKWSDKLKVTVLVERNPDDSLSACVVDQPNDPGKVPSWFARGPNLIKGHIKDLETAKGRAYAAIKKEFPRMSLEVKWQVDNSKLGPKKVEA